MSVVNTVGQLQEDGTLIAMFQTESTRDAYHWVCSAQRFHRNRRGRILGFFDASGNRIEWRQGPADDWANWDTHTVIHAT